MPEQQSETLDNRGDRDQFGNYWPATPPNYSELSRAEFSEIFSQFRHIVVDPPTNLIIAAGQSHDALAYGLIARNLDPKNYGVEGTGVFESPAS